MRWDKIAAKENGVPKAFRQYSKRYGAGVDSLIRDHRKYPAAMLDHWRDRLLRMAAFK